MSRHLLLTGLALGACNHTEHYAQKHLALSLMLWSWYLSPWKCYLIRRGYNGHSYVWIWELDYKESWAMTNWCFLTAVLEKTWESLGLWGDQTSQSKRRSGLNTHWKDWYWSWSSNTLPTWREELTPWKRPWCWERLKARGEGADRGWDGWMVSLTQWTWVWTSSGSWWWTGKPRVLQSMGSQRVRHDWATELNWTMGVHMSRGYTLSVRVPHSHMVFVMLHEHRILVDPQIVETQQDPGKCILSTPE